jgi:tetratricopeptide (TPR) repeat protein
VNPEQQRRRPTQNNRQRQSQTTFDIRHPASGIQNFPMPWVLACALLVAVAPSAHVPPSRQADATALFERAVALQDAGQLDAAAETYRAFLEQHPRNVEAWSNLGVVYSRLGRFNEAIAAYQQALSFSHLNTPVRMNLALAYYKSGRHRQAIGEFDVVIAANPGCPTRCCSRPTRSCSSAPSPTRPRC